MHYALCHLSVVSLRKSPSNRSEQVSQLLFGEVVEVIEKKGKQWAKVRCTWDHVIGWVAMNQITPITDKEFQTFSEDYSYCLDLFQPVYFDDNMVPVTLGARLPGFDGLKFEFNGKTCRYTGLAVEKENLGPVHLLKIAHKLMYAPHQWGGRSPLGIDSSGFVQLVYQMAGISLPRDANQQVFIGEVIDFAEQAKPGDLAFFENSKGTISHVGIVLEDGKLIHCWEKVRIDPFDHFGVYNHNLQRYTHKMRVIKRLIPQAEILPLDKKETGATSNVTPVSPDQLAMFD
ncbi:MAG: C40 family peptidase [Saprospiraceae bacterium]|jgi:hypothetical protein